MGIIAKLFLLIGALFGLVFRMVRIIGFFRLAAVLAIAFLINRSRRDAETDEMDPDLPQTV